MNPTETALTMKDEKPPQGPKYTLVIEGKDYPWT
jgi:hypothetical protein